jgi:hypothetical protein
MRLRQVPTYAQTGRVVLAAANANGAEREAIPEAGQMRQRLRVRLMRNRPRLLAPAPRCYSRQLRVFAVATER